MGKSTAADLLRQRGLPVSDSDVIARQVVEPGQPALAEIQQLFGREIVGDDGRPAALAVIPLLFETDAGRHFDATICVACSEKTQRHRLRARGWTDEQIDQRLAAQWPVEKKMLLADYVVWTEGPLEVHQAQLDRIARGVSPH